MEGLRISIILIGAFVAGMSTRAFLGTSLGAPEHLAAADACEACATCNPALLSSR